MPSAPPPPGSPPGPGPRSLLSLPALGASLTVAAREIRASFRDRQAVLYTVVLPVAMYPVLFWVILQGFLVIQGVQENTTVEVGLVRGAGAPTTPELAQILGDDEGTASRGAVELRPLPQSDRDPAALVHAGEVDAVLEPGALEDGGARLLMDTTRSRSALAASRVQERMERHAETLRAEALGHPTSALEPFTLEVVDHAEEDAVSAYVLSFILPMMFVIMVVMGCFFPAVDATAGEKERGTAETTLLLPVPRVAVLLGKVLAVAFAGSLATALGLTGMILAGEHLLAGLGEEFTIVVPWGGLAGAAPLLFLFVLTTAALLVAVASLAETFKQGQSMVGGVQMALVLPGVLVAMPGIDLTPGLALVPGVQTVLAFQALLRGTGGVGLELVLVSVSQVAYALLALGLSLRIGSREGLLLGAGSLGRMVQILRTGGAPR